MITLLVADAYLIGAEKRIGRVHRFDRASDKTFCGKNPKDCAGPIGDFPDDCADKVNCKGCLARLERRKRKVIVYVAGSVLEEHGAEDDQLGTWDELAAWRRELFGDATVEAGQTAKGRFVYGGPTIIYDHGVGVHDLPEDCLREVYESEILFAWIDTPNTVGTLIEIGFARAHNKSLFLAFPDDALRRRFYFGCNVRGAVDVIAVDATAAWSYFVSWQGGE